MQSKIYIFRVFETHVEKPISYNVFSIKKIGTDTEYGFYINKLPYSVLLPESNVEFEDSYLICGGKFKPFTIHFSKRKDLINHIYLQKVKEILKMRI